MSSEFRSVRVSARLADNLFQSWLKQRGKEFPHRIIPRPVRSVTPRWPKTGREYSFAGITTDLYFSVQPDTLRTHFDLAGIYYDTLHDMEIDPAVDKRGLYACECCAENYSSPKIRSQYPNVKREKYFKTLPELYADHCFEKLLRWAKRAIRKNNLIIYGGELDGPRVALIAPMQAVRYFDAPYQVQRLILPGAGANTFISCRRRNYSP